jgi:hypothetical protein
MLRKQILPKSPAAKTRRVEEISIPDVATVLITSEMPEHPIDHICDDQRGPGGTRWIAGEPGEQTLILVFDTPRNLHAVDLEIEEPDVSRTQELSLAVSNDGGQTYREVLRQEYNFSPPHTTFEREEWHVPAEAVTNLRLSIKPDKGGKLCRATITSLGVQ